jgi:hypothetical protein
VATKIAPTDGAQATAAPVKDEAKKKTASKAGAQAITVMKPSVENEALLGKELRLVPEYRKTTSSWYIKSQLYGVNNVHRGPDFTVTSRVYKKSVSYMDGKLVMQPGMVKLECMVVDRERLAEKQEPRASAIQALKSWVVSLKTPVVCFIYADCAYEKNLLAKMGFTQIGKVAWGKEKQYPGLIMAYGFTAAQVAAKPKIDKKGDKKNEAKKPAQKKKGTVKASAKKKGGASKTPAVEEQVTPAADTAGGTTQAS